MRITPAELAATRAKLDKINARAAKRGFTGHFRLDWSPVEVAREVAPGLTVIEHMYDAELHGAAPSYEGWTFLATLDNDPHAGLIVRYAPGQDESVVDRGAFRPDWCDHCQTNRRRRKIYMVRHDDGRQVQVGSTCIKDFLGWSASIVWLSTDDVERDLMSGGGWGPADRSYATVSVLAVAWALVTTFGYVRAADPGATKDKVFQVMEPRKAWDADLIREITPALPHAEERAAELLAWLRSDECTGSTSEYMRNLTAIAAADVCSPRSVGFLASAPQAWAKHQEQTLIRQRENEEWLNEPFGAPGARVVVKVQVKAVRFLDGAYGVTTLYKMRDEAGHALTWFASTDLLGDVPGDKWFTLKATIKEHGQWKERWETRVTRCKIIEEES